MGIEVRERLGGEGNKYPKSGVEEWGGTRAVTPQNE